MKRKIRVGVIFGGKSGEHEVSLQSAKNVIEAMDPQKYEVIPIAIDKKGKWLAADSKKYLLNADDPKRIKLNSGSNKIAVVPGGESRGLVPGKTVSGGTLDVVFPVLHGPYGEDGSVQGLLKLAGVPFVGAGVLGSAVGMDKDVTKRLLRDAGIPIGKFAVLREVEKTSFNALKKELGLPFFVKPANLGSSIGVSKVENKNEFAKAIKEAFKYDVKILAEEFIKGREIECSVLGNENPIASVPGEVLPKHEFYSYEAKYLDEDGAVLQIPANLPPGTVKRVQDLAKKVFKVLCVEGMGRVDFFLKENGDVLVNEINTIPGFTSISMYPKLWEASGISYSRLIDLLISLAIKRSEKEKKIKTSYTP